jgi:cyclic beta-1,2-glucan synthetase
VAHTDSELDESRLTRFVRVFQESAPLTIGELWALPTMLRLVLLENLRRLGGQMIRGWDEHHRAERWAVEALSDEEGTDGRRVADPTDPSDPFVVRLLEVLRDQGPQAAEALGRLEQLLESRGVGVNDVLQREHRRQAANQVSVGNCVISLRLLSAMDWNAFFERSSLVESILRSDPDDLHALQDFATRDRYRRAVEELAKRSGGDELDVARRAVELARLGRVPEAAQGHVGDYLVGRGRRGLEAELGYRPAWSERLLGAVVGHPKLVYLGAIGLVLAGVLAVACLALMGRGAVVWWWLAVVAALVLPASELAVGLVNHVLTLVLPPRVLPKLEFKDGIPDDFMTFVVMPSMLSGPESAAMLVERLEIHYLANPDRGLRFALLTDFSDAPHETMPEDEDYVRDATERVAELNRRYRGDGPDLFFLFHRRRIWNPAEGCWMGWERKRGKLSEFNRLLRGDRGTSFTGPGATPLEVPHARFVITLDADTKMTRDTALRLVGTLAHPLNRPRFDAAAGRVVEGFGVLQPRVSFHLTAATHSRFAALLAASGGIDPYSTAASDTYMDLFGFGSFTGKGIYEVDAFEAATGRTFPENRILSHDLIEGNYARCGLLSDTELFDDFPARYHAYARREHRWVRGDWQLLPWLGRRVPTPDGSRANPLPWLEQWKMLDNLRRSLVPPALVAMLALGWTVLPGPPWYWTVAALGVLALPLLQAVTGTVAGAVLSRSLEGLKRWPDVVAPTAGRVALAAVFLADQARLLTDAVVRTLVRLYVTRRNLLEWETAASTERRLGTGLVPFALSMWPAPALALGLAVLLALVRPGALAAAGPVLAVWLVSPVVAFWVSQARPARERPLSDAERRALRRVARKTWLFFETFVGDDDHWLPPDNFQEIPVGRIAHRTSPTNQGLLLVSTLAAHDLGYIGLGTLVERLERTFDTLEEMERHWGHFYNWYDTRTLLPLPPAYISTVDSGNFLGCLVALRRGLKEKAVGLVIGPEVCEGVADALALAVGEGAAPSTLEVLLHETPADLRAWHDWLERAAAAVGGLQERPLTRSDRAGPLDERAAWTRRLSDQIRGHQLDLSALVPWLGPLRAVEARGRSQWSSDGAAERWESIRSVLIDPRLAVAATAGGAELLAELEALAGETSDAGPLRAIAAALQDSGLSDLLERLGRLGDRAEALSLSMDFRPLYKEDRHLFAVGCNLAQGSLDGACYDLLASESSLASYLTVARGDAPRRHWFQLGRPFIRGAGRLGLVSWGGTMFEYLMPRLLLRSLPGTLVAEAANTAVARQIEYGRQKGVPWGISESAFNAQYAEGDYQYQAFGVPGLGLKRGLDLDLVIAPYATAMAAMIAPREAVENFRRLSAAGAEGVYGFYEAIDFTPERVPRGESAAVVRSYMAHHQGMSLVALANAVLGDPMPRRFHGEPLVRAAELLLQERVPRDAPVVEPSETAAAAEADEPRVVAPLMSRRLTSPSTPSPRTHLLSNSTYHVLMTNAGSGYSTCRGLDVTRWREDLTRDAWGQFIYVRDVESGLVWSAGHQPVCRPAESYEVTFAADKVGFRRRDADIETLLEVTVSPEQPAEVRRVTLTSHDTRPRVVELTSYVEVVLGTRGSDLAHPAFGKLFLETERLAGSGALLCRRRPRAAGEEPVWAMHVAAVDPAAHGGTVSDDIACETDRDRFLGRGRTPARPAALDPGATLSGTTGAVLDPVLSLRLRVRLEPGGSAIVAFTTAVATSREDALGLADHYHQASAAARAFELAWAQSQFEHRYRGWSAEEAHLYQRLGAHLVFASAAQRAAPAEVAASRLAQPALWRFGISGDRPIVLAGIAAPEQVALARQLLVAHSFLRLKGLEFDLVLLNEESTSYLEGLNRHLLEVVRGSGVHELADRPGGIFVRKMSPMADEERALLRAAARVVLSGDLGPLNVQLDRVERLPALPPPLEPARAPGFRAADTLTLPGDLLFPNGLGGFRPDGQEYCLLTRGPVPHDVERDGVFQGRTPAGRDPVLPPAPWANVVANPGFGFLVTEAGSGFTWAVNSQLNRLTPWSNDPVSDPPGEVVYVRDDDTGEVWTPTPLPIVSTAPTLVRHGQGYTVFERNCHGLAQELTLLVSPDDPVKLIRLRLTNRVDRRRRLSATFYVEWVLGTTRDAQAMHVVTEIDRETGALLARNAFRTDLGARVAFVDVDRRPRAFTADRTEFLGRNGDVSRPAALRRVTLSGRAGAVLDPCAAMQVSIDMGPNEEREVVFLLGEADDLAAVRALVGRYRAPGRAAQTLAEVRRRWDSLLGAVQVHTPDPALDLLLNRWLLYQVVSCRLWARSAFYQSGGAYGFRDQLQDVAALTHAAPGLAREHILLAASRQFVEGDVQHWWHPPAGRGVRTRFSDDFLWLPFIVAHHVGATGDTGLLDQPVPFLKGPQLAPQQEDDYGLPAVADEAGTIYDHCVRAIEHGLRLGPHGLPLMGTGDWNDGMNRVGAGGRGESVWVAWFLIVVLRDFATLSESRGDAPRAARWREAEASLRENIEAHAWDGAWYRRAFFDDGTPLGSVSPRKDDRQIDAVAVDGLDRLIKLGSSPTDECQIDSIAQSWAVISAAADPERARQAMRFVDRLLVRRDDQLILLFDPPFDAGTLEPGYIKGYLPGIRENGGQYTHAATWVVLAFALLGDGDRAAELLRLLNPIGHADDPQRVARYRVEPYVVAADVYSRPPHVGRGGWTWYTGSAAWLYRVALEGLLGFRRSGDRLTIDPCIPPHWTHFELTYRHGSATYRVHLDNPQRVGRGVQSITVDGVTVHNLPTVELVDDGANHEVCVVLGPS